MPRMRRMMLNAPMVLLLLQAAEVEQRRLAQDKQKEAETAQQRAEASEKRTSDLLYSAKLNLAQVAFEQSNFRRVHELLEETLGGIGGLAPSRRGEVGCHTPSA